MGVSSKEAVDNVITALTLNSMIAPSYRVDPKNGNNYMLAVQYPETQVNSITDLKQIPLHAAGNLNSTDLDAVSDVKMINTPTEVDHYQLRRVIDVYVSPRSEDLGGLANQVDKIVANTKLPENVRVTMRGSVEGMRQSFKSFSIGLILSVVLILGYSKTQEFQLVEDTTAISSPLSNVDDLISQAFAMRPEILSLEFQEQSAQKFHIAERDLLLSNIRAVGAVGDTPVRNPVLSNWYVRNPSI